MDRKTTENDERVMNLFRQWADLAALITCSLPQRGDLDRVHRSSREIDREGDPTGISDRCAARGLCPAGDIAVAAPLSPSMLIVQMASLLDGGRTRGTRLRAEVFGGMVPR
jgi:hypothetical protein